MRLAGWSSVVLVLTSTLRALGADATAPTEAPNESAKVIVPPRLEVAPEPPAYPAGAQGDATIVVTVTVNRDGTVRSATAEPREPFSSIAIARAQALRFLPATRGGQAVAAVIRLEFAFHEPQPPQPETEESSTPEPTAPGGSAAAAPAKAQTKGTTVAAPATKAPAAIEIEVRGAKLAPAATSLTRGEVRQLPGAFGDPFRAIESLPGVTPIISGLPFFYIRGAPPGNVGYFLDGVRVPYLYHVGLGPSIVHPGLVSSVDLYPGGYPASFGRFAGGIVSGETLGPNPVTHAEGNIRLFDAGALAETGFANGRGTILLGGRYSYTAALLSLIAKDATLGYRDYQARVSYDVTPRDRITAFSFGSYDLVGQTTNNVFSVLFGSEFYRLDLRHEHHFGSGATLHSAVVLGFDQTRIGDQRNSQDRMLGVRSRFEQPLSGGSTWRAGFDVTLDKFSADQRTYADPEDPDTIRFNNLFPPRSDQAGGVWTDLVWYATDRVEVTPGLRLDVFGSGGANAFAVDPRVAAKFKITNRFRIVHAYGIVHQPPSFVVPIPGLTPGKLQGGLQSAWQTSAGVEVDLPQDIGLTATLFHNAFFNMSDVLSLAATSGRDDALDQRAAGASEGFELYLHRNLTRKLGGYLSYTLSRSTRELDGYSFPSAFDRTHVASTALAYDLGRHWRAGGRFVFYTGAPKSSRVPGATAPKPDPHPPRDAAFYRLDVRLEKRWQLGQRAWISFVFEFMNATLHKETFGNREIGPISIPSIGVEGGF